MLNMSKLMQVSIPQFIFNSCYTYFTTDIFISNSILLKVTIPLSKHSHFCHTHLLSMLRFQSSTHIIIKHHWSNQSNWHPIKIFPST
uniref:Uncharacterized protein n=1 Tax=Rhizophora mucronata TaxID=61149 RepID=A0A2P2R1I8_RHIMU